MSLAEAEHTDTPHMVYTPQDVAELFHISARTVRDKAHRGDWPALVFGPRTVRFTSDQLAAIIEKQTHQPTPAQAVRRIGTRARNN